jgi:HEAT repeat protein
MERGRVDYASVRNVLGCEDVDVSNIEVFLSSDNELVRGAAVEIIGAKGRMELLVEVAKKETERTILMRIVDCFRDRPEGVERLVELLESEDEIVFEETIGMFRRLGREDCLFGLVFSRDSILVERVKRYINEQKERQASST